MALRSLDADYAVGSKPGPPRLKALIIAVPLATRMDSPHLCSLHELLTIQSLRHLLLIT